MQGVKAAEAAPQLGISTEAVRMRLKRRTLSGVKDKDGTWRVYLPATERTPNADPTVSQRPNERLIVASEALGRIEAVTGDETTDRPGANYPNREIWSRRAGAAH